MQTPFAQPPATPRLTEAKATALFLQVPKVAHWLGRYPRKGRVTAGLLRELIPDPTAALVYACGPAIGPHERAAARARGEAPQPRFLESALEALREAGVPDGRVRTESYG